MGRTGTLSSRLIATALALGTTGASYTPALVQAQDSRVGGSATSGTAVRTGRGPLSYPVPPAVSTLNPPQSPQRPQGFRGPAMTSPPAHPFGSRQ